LERFVRSAVVLLVALLPLAAVAQDGTHFSTHCREVDLELDSKHSVSLLAGCGEEYPEDLLWHLDRIDQVTGALDGKFDRKSRGEEQSK